jgi:hypothetical protein
MKNLIAIIIVTVLLFSCSSKADRRFQFDYSSSFMVNEFEVFEGVPATLSNISLGEALAEKLKAENSSFDKMHDVILTKAIISIDDTIISFADIDDFKLEAVGKGEKAGMKTIGNGNSENKDSKSIPLTLTADDLVHYLKDSGLLFIVSGEGKKDIENAFGMKIDLTFDIGVKN